MTPRTFLLSPASCSGRRAAILLAPRARFDLASRTRSRAGAPLGEVFAFLSGLYFRGKLAYARAFGLGDEPLLVITAGDGLLAPEAPATAARLRRFARIDVDVAEGRYVRPLLRDAQALRERIGPQGEVVLLGSIATDKYCGPLGEVFGDRLLFPAAFVGRGDMSRGGLMLRCAHDRVELDYVPVRGATRRGSRPAKLSPLRGRGYSGGPRMPAQLARRTR